MERVDKGAMATEQGRVILARASNRLQVWVPREPIESYHAFTGKALELGRYRKRTGMWSFGIWQREEVVKLIEECYGKEALPQ